MPEVLAALLEVLRGLSAEAWQRPTACRGWSVKDVALHLLGGELGNLSRRRDRHKQGGATVEWAELVAFINRHNAQWVEAARGISPRLLIDLLAYTGEQMDAYFSGLDPHTLDGPVSWAGPEPAPVWLDVAREYTERWHHQQHIRDAAARPGLKEARYLGPVLATFARAMPRALRDVDADPGTALTLTVTGAAGGRWSAVREPGRWTLWDGAPPRPAAEVIVAEDPAWRLFTRGLDSAEARARVAIRGDRALGLRLVEMAAIIA
jgi:uncharacterized protein (TIGR03083 family)